MFPTVTFQASYAFWSTRKSSHRELWLCLILVLWNTSWIYLQHAQLQSKNGLPLSHFCSSSWKGRSHHEECLARVLHPLQPSNWNLFHRPSSKFPLTCWLRLFIEERQLLLQVEALIYSVDDAAEDETPTSVIFRSVAKVQGFLKANGFLDERITNSLSDAR